MKRLLWLLGAAAVAGAMYAATALGGRATAPTSKQFAALKKQVSKLQTELSALATDEGQLKNLADAEGTILVACLNEAVPVDQYGDAVNQTEGYAYQFSDSSIGLTTALDVADSTDTNPWYFLSGTTDCANAISGGGALRRVAALTRAPQPVPQLHPATPHQP